MQDQKNTCFHFISYFFLFFPTNPQLFLYHKKAWLLAYILPLVSALHQENLQL